MILKIERMAEITGDVFKADEKRVVSIGFQFFQASPHLPRFTRTSFGEDNYPAVGQNIIPAVASGKVVSDSLIPMILGVGRACGRG